MFVRAFMRLRHILATHADLTLKLDELEQKTGCLILNSCYTINLTL